MSTSEQEVINKFKAIGLSHEKARETAQNKKLGPILLNVIQKASAEQGAPKETGVLLYQLASTSGMNPHLDLICSKIASKELLTQDQVTAAVKFTAKKDKILIKEFDQECGVGVLITENQVIETINKVFVEKMKELVEKRYQYQGLLFGLLRKELKWANQGQMKNHFDAKILEILGPKDERDDIKLQKKIQNKNTLNKPQTVAELAKSEKFIFEGELSKLHKPGENPQIRSEIMEAHLKRTGGKVVTRFPPEPNGYLHIGHAKAINISFGYAKAHGGITYLRYDDTNPEAEEGEYFKGMFSSSFTMVSFTNICIRNVCIRNGFIHQYLHSQWFHSQWFHSQWFHSPIFAFAMFAFAMVSFTNICIRNVCIRNGFIHQYLHSQCLYSQWFHSQIFAFAMVSFTNVIITVFFLPSSLDITNR
jgi:glutaminyl-tRNA synthetase